MKLILQNVSSPYTRYDIPGYQVTGVPGNRYLVRSRGNPALSPLITFACFAGGRPRVRAGKATTGTRTTVRHNKNWTKQQLVDTRWLPTGDALSTNNGREGADPAGSQRAVKNVCSILPKISSELQDYSRIEALPLL